MDRLVAIAVSRRYLMVGLLAVVMIGGLIDAIHPVEISQMPMFRHLGSANKEIKHFESGHLPPVEETIKFADGVTITTRNILPDVSFETTGIAGSDLTITGTEGDDLLSVTEVFQVYQRQTLSGLGGNDAIFGGYRNDVIDGGDGDDTIQGYGGGDIIHGGSGAAFDWIDVSPSFAVSPGDRVIVTITFTVN